MRSFGIFLVLGILVCQNAQAVHPVPSIFNSCVYTLATPHRPDTRPPGSLTTPEERCQTADTFALSNVPTVPVAVIEPAGGTGYYCTIDGNTLATPDNLSDLGSELAETVTGVTSCAGDAVCQDLFGETSTCAAFENDATGASPEGWISQGPAESISIAADLAGQLGAHSVYVRSPDGLGNIFYFSAGALRTHSLQGPDHGNQPIQDITFCQAPNSPVVQKRRPPDCEGFFCLPIPCCGPHFPCDGEPNIPPQAPEPTDRLAGLDRAVEGLIDSGDLSRGHGRWMRQRLARITRALGKGRVEKACNRLGRFDHVIDRGVHNGNLNVDKAAPLRRELALLDADLSCT